MPLLKFNTTPSSMNSNAVSLVLILIKLVFKLGSFDSSGWIAKHQAAHGKMARFLKLSLTVTTPSQQQSPCIYIIRRQMLFGYMYAFEQSYCPRFPTTFCWNFYQKCRNLFVNKKLFGYFLEANVPLASVLPELSQRLALNQSEARKNIFIQIEES